MEHARFESAKELLLQTFLSLASIFIIVLVPKFIFGLIGSLLNADLVIYYYGYSLPGPSDDFWDVDTVFVMYFAPFFISLLVVIFFLIYFLQNNYRYGVLKSFLLWGLYNGTSFLLLRSVMDISFKTGIHHFLDWLGIYYQQEIVMAFLLLVAMFGLAYIILEHFVIDAYMCFPDLNAPNDVIFYRRIIWPYILSTVLYILISLPEIPGHEIATWSIGILPLYMIFLNPLPPWRVRHIVENAQSVPAHNWINPKWALSVLLLFLVFCYRVVLYKGLHF